MYFCKQNPNHLLNRGILVQTFRQRFFFWIGCSRANTRPFIGHVSHLSLATLFFLQNGLISKPSRHHPTTPTPIQKSKRSNLLQSTSLITHPTEKNKSYVLFCREWMTVDIKLFALANSHRNRRCISSGSSIQSGAVAIWPEIRPAAVRFIPVPRPERAAAGSLELSR